jgi:hypothetical protein
MVVENVPWGFFFEDLDGGPALSIPDAGGMADSIPRVREQLEWLEARLSELPERDALERVWPTVWKLRTPAALEAVRALLRREGGEEVADSLQLYSNDPPPRLREAVSVLTPTERVVRVIVEQVRPTPTVQRSALAFAPEHREWLVAALRRVVGGLATAEHDEGWDELLRVERTERGARVSSSRRIDQTQPSFSAIELSVTGAARLARELEAKRAELFVRERSPKELLALLESENAALARRAAEEIVADGAEVAARLGTVMSWTCTLAPIWAHIARHVVLTVRDMVGVKARSAATEACERALRRLDENDALDDAVKIVVARDSGNSEPDREWSHGSRRLELVVSDTLTARSYDNFATMIGAERSQTWEATSTDPASADALRALLAWHEDLFAMLARRGTLLMAEVLGLVLLVAGCASPGWDSTTSRRPLRARSGTVLAERDFHFHAVDVVTVRDGPRHVRVDLLAAATLEPEDHALLPGGARRRLEPGAAGLGGAAEGVLA